MINKRFSLHEAYSFGIKSVVNHFGFFLAAMSVGSLAALVFLSVLGILDYWMFKDHFQTLIKTFSHAMSEATGAIHQTGLTLHDYVRTVAPVSVAKHLAPRDVVSIDTAGQDFKSLLQLLLPVGLLFKLFLDVISVGWTKMALDLQANQAVGYDYLYKFYYFVPRVFVVNFLVFFLTMIAAMVGVILLCIPGLVLYQRLRFAKYFVIDKNYSITQSLGSSWKMTEGSVIHLIGYSIFAALVASFGNMFFLTVLFVMPLSYQVEASVYRQMVK